MKRSISDSLKVYFCVFLVAIGSLFTSLVEAQEGPPLPPLKSWRISSGLQCDFNSPSMLYESFWPGDSPHEVLQKYVANLNTQCAERGGANYTLSYALNACTPNITIGSGMAIAIGCTMNQILTPKPNCTPASSCTVKTSLISAPAPSKVCVDTNQGSGNGSVPVLVGPDTYVECMCPEGSEYVTHNGVSRCVPVVNQTRKPPDMCVGNPIHPGTGNKRQKDIDYIGTGIAPLTFSRTYNSAAPFDRAWTSNFHRSTTWVGVGAHATHLFHRSEGSFPFRWNGSAYTTDADVQMRYGGWNLTLPDERRVEHYTPIQVNATRTVRVADAVRTLAGTALHTLTYSASTTPVSIAPYPGLLIKVSDPFGRSLNLTYNAQGQMASMTDPGGGLYVYEYDASGALLTVTYPDGAVREYAYNEPAHTGGASQPGLLTGIIDESAQRYATFGYNSDGLAVLTEHAGGADRHTVSYSSAPSVVSELILDSSNNVQYVKKYYQPPAAATLTDALGQARQYTFVQSSGSTRTTGSDFASNGFCSSIPQERAFDANGNAISVADFDGNVTTYVYDLTRNLETSRTEASGTASARTIATQWHPTLRLPTQIDEPGRRTTFTYDSSGNTLTKTVRDNATSASRTWTYTYNSYGQVLTANGPRTDVNDTTTYTYYTCTTGFQCGQIATITNAQNQTTTFNTYNAHGQPLTITDPNGLVTTLTYDLRQRLTSRTVGTETTTFEYWPTGLLKKATLPDGSFIAYTYDAAHRLVQVADDEGNRVDYTLDAMGNRLREDVYDPALALTNTRSRVFNTLNRLTQEIGAGNTAAVTTTLGYDAQGNETSVSAPLGRNTTQTYDPLNRLSQVMDPASGVTQYGYNALDQLISVTDPRNKVTSYTYNAFDDVTQLVSPDTGTTTSTYDSAGNLKTQTDARGAAVTYSYDALNRTTQAVWSDQTIQYTYDQGPNALGRLSSVSDNSGQTSWSYDLQGRPVSRQQVMGGISLGSSVSYDNAGRPSIVSYPSGHYLQFGYANGKVTSITLDGGTAILTDVLYEPFGPVRGWTWGNSTLAAHGRDLDGKVEYIDSAGLRTYNYDDAFRITGITDAVDPSLSQSYSYDLLDRLTGTNGSSLNQSWTYDPNGNRLTEGGSNPSTYSIAANSNRLTSVTGALTRSYTYDAAGNTLSDGTTNFTYDQAGRLVSATKSGITATYALNALGQRVRKTVAGVSTYFFYDESGRLMGEYDSGGAMVQEIVWLGDTPVASIRPGAGGSGVGVFYIHTDHLGAPTKLTRPNDNAIVWRWDRDPFGNGAPDEDPDGNSQIVQFNLRFPGQYFDAETGLNYNYFRDYDPATGRYVQSDPIGLAGGINTYTYVSNQPLTMVDPQGLDGFFPNRCAPGFHNKWSTSRGWTCQLNPERRNENCPSGDCAAFPAENNCSFTQACVDKIIKGGAYGGAVLSQICSRATGIPVISGVFCKSAVEMYCGAKTRDQCNQKCDSDASKK